MISQSPKLKAIWKHVASYGNLVSLSKINKYKHNRKSTKTTTKKSLGILLLHDHAKKGLFGKILLKDCLVKEQFVKGNHSLAGKLQLSNSILQLANSQNISKCVVR